MVDDQARAADAMERVADAAETAANPDSRRWFSERVTLYLKELPSALILSVMTAVVTLLLAVFLSVVMGGANVEHREASRCGQAAIYELILEIAEQNQLNIDLDEHPPFNLDGVDCSLLQNPVSDEGG